MTGSKRSLREATTRASIDQLGLQPATTGRSRVTGLGQVNGSQDAGYARSMSKVLF